MGLASGNPPRQACEHGITSQSTEIRIRARTDAMRGRDVHLSQASSAGVWGRQGLLMAVLGWECNQDLGPELNNSRMGDSGARRGKWMEASQTGSGTRQ